MLGLLVQRHGERDEPLDGAGKEVAIGRHAVHAPGARRTLQKIGYRLGLQRELRRQLMHARRLRAVALEQRRELPPQRLVLRRQHRAMIRQAQARAFAREAPSLYQVIDHGDERCTDVGGTRPDRVGMRRVPRADGAHQRFALHLPSLAPHDVAHAAHLERHQLWRFARRHMEHLLEPLGVHHPVRQQPVEGLLRPEPGDALPAPARRGQRIHHRARADQALRAGIAQQQPVAVPRAHAVREREPGEALVRRQASLEHRGAEVHAHGLGARNRRPEPRHLDVEVLRHGHRPGVGEHVAAPDFVPLHAVQCERAALARCGARRFAVVRTQAAHAHLAAGGQDLHLVACGHRTRGHGPGYDETDAVDDEGAIDVHAKALRRIARRNHLRQALQPRAQRIDALARRGRHLQYLRIRKQRAQFRFRFDPALRRHAIDLRQHAQDARRAQVLEDREVLAGLRHDAVVGRHHQQREIDASHARRHVAHEALVPGHVDEGDRSQVSETEVDRHAAALLLRQAVGVHAGERAHE
ncbi:MAG: hypothetical protein WD775_14045 [Burkholderiales bacterium]